MRTGRPGSHVGRVVSVPAANYAWLVAMIRPPATSGVAHVEPSVLSYAIYLFSWMGLSQFIVQAVANAIYGQDVCWFARVGF